MRYRMSARERRRQQIWRRAERKRSRETRRERRRLEKVAESLHAIVRDALRVRDTERGRETVMWGDRAIAALANAQRALNEARRQGVR